MLPPTPAILGAIAAAAEGQWGTRGGCTDGSEPKEPRGNCTLGCIRVVYISSVTAVTEGWKSATSDSLWSTAPLRALPDARLPRTALALRERERPIF